MSDNPRPSNLYPALLAAMQGFGPVLKDASNPAFRSKYATLQSVFDAVEGPLWANGLLLVQRLNYDRIGNRDATQGDGTPILITELVHAASGEKIESVAAVVCKDPLDPQKVGSAITYYRRYSLMSLLGLTGEDDDGNAAAAPAPPRRAEAARPAPVATVRHEPAQAQPAALRDDDPLAPVLAELRALEAKPEPWALIKVYADTQAEIADEYGKQAINATLHAIAARRKAAVAPAPTAPSFASAAG